MMIKRLAFEGYGLKRDGTYTVKQILEYVAKLEHEDYRNRL